VYFFHADSNIIKYETSSFKFNITTSPSLIINNILFFTIIARIVFYLDLGITRYEINKLNVFMNNFLFEDSKNILEIMTSNYQNIFVIQV